MNVRNDFRRYVERRGRLSRVTRISHVLWIAVLGLPGTARAQDDSDTTTSRSRADARPSTGVYGGHVEFADLLLGLHVSYPIHRASSGFVAVTNYSGSRAWGWSLDAGLEAGTRFILGGLAYVRVGVRWAMTGTGRWEPETMGITEVGALILDRALSPFMGVRQTWAGSDDTELLLGLRYSLGARTAQPGR